MSKWLPISCPNCKRKPYLWNVEEAIKNDMMCATHLKPMPLLSELLDIKQPQPGDIVECPICHHKDIKRALGILYYQEKYNILHGRKNG